MAEFKRWAQANTGKDNAGIIFAALYLGEQLERVANALEKIIVEEYGEEES
jgi:hypothetical protein